MNSLDKNFASGFFIAFCVLILFLIPSPAHPSEKPMQFKFTCPTTMKWRPVCLQIGLETRQQFSECRSEVEQYISELDQEYSCIADAFTKYINKIINKVEGHLVCHQENILRAQNDNQLVACEAMKREIFVTSKHEVFMSRSWGEPLSLYSKRCLEPGIINDTKFLVSCVYGWQNFITEAPQLHKEYLKNLAADVSKEKQDTVGCFNDWSKGLLYSSSC